MAQDRVPLYVRLPREQAAALDRLVDTTGQHKQSVVSELLADRLEVGRIDIAERSGVPSQEVLTLEELARLLRLPAEALQALANDGELPGRRIAGEWRFVRQAVLDWLAEGERAVHSGTEAGFAGTDG
jgi:excisionase family DNA binding protein